MFAQHLKEKEETRIDGYHVPYFLIFSFLKSLYINL